MTDQFIRTLYQLRDEAETANHTFLAHILRLAILEASNLAGSQHRRYKPDGDGHA